MAQLISRVRRLADKINAKSLLIFGRIARERFELSWTAKLSKVLLISGIV